MRSLRRARSVRSPPSCHSSHPMALKQVRFQEPHEESEAHGPVEVFMTVAGRKGKGEERKELE